jgi:hypothetical protein
MVAALEKRIAFANVPVRLGLALCMLDECIVVHVMGWGSGMITWE